MNSNELRQKYLKFFEEKGHDHKIVPSTSLVPEGDSTTLFTGSGMQPMMPYLLGAKHPLGSRIVDSQRCFRAEDIEEVGDNRHTTFFEMLGNWSFGDYWKEEQLTWLFEFLTKEVGLDPDRLYVSVFGGDPENNIPRDEESPEIWQKLFGNAKIVTEEQASNLGMQDGKIFYYGSKKNWWSRAGVPSNMPVGEPGGPDSEIFYQFDVKHDEEKYGKYCHPNCDCGQFMEIGNSVFMEYVKTDKGFEKLKQRNVDFGGGLERITAASNENPDIFQIDIFKRMGEALLEYQKPENIKKIRIILDHLRASIHLINDGIEPSNKERGYILRRILRRAIFHIINLTAQDALKPLGVEVVPLWDEKAYKVIDQIISNAILLYPELKEGEAKIKEIINKEFGKFTDLLKSTSELNKFIKKALNSRILSGEDAFMLFSSHGLPIDYIKDEAQKFSIKVDEKGFEEAFKKHQELSRTASAGMFKGGLASHSDKIVRLHTATHLMNAALRKVLGENVWQKGSNITEERTRFDFTHDKKMTDEEKQEVEKLVNDWVARDLTVKRETMPLEEARKLGAIGVFGEKYPDTVSVYTVFDPKTDEVVSREFCGGPHAEHTGVIGKFKIQKEEAVSSGVRRIKAVVE